MVKTTSAKAKYLADLLITAPIAETLREASSLAILLHTFLNGKVI